MKRRGFSLIEMLCVMALLAVLAIVLAVMFKTIMDVERTQAASFERLLQSKELADQFRTDVAQAMDAPQRWQNHRADEQTLILLMKNSDTVVYSWKQGKLTRILTQGEEETERQLPISDKSIAVEFGRPESNAKLLRLRLIPARIGEPLVGQSLEIVAALGGDVQ